MSAKEYTRRSHVQLLDRSHRDPERRRRREGCGGGRTMVEVVPPPPPKLLTVVPYSVLVGLVTHWEDIAQSRGLVRVR